MMVPHRSKRAVSLMHALRRIGLNSSAVHFCLDAGDAVSIGTANLWSDISGNGRNFYLGSSGAADAAQPSVNGSAGRLTNDEYLGFDGADYILFAASNTAFMETLHKAGAVFTVLAWVRLATGGTQTIFNTKGASTSTIGVQLFASTSGNWSFNLGNGSANSAVLSHSSVPDGSWAFLAISFVEGVGYVHQINSQQTTGSASFSSPSSSAPAGTFMLGGRNPASLAQPMVNGSRYGAAALIERALSAGELMAIFNETRARYGV